MRRWRVERQRAEAEAARREAEAARREAEVARGREVAAARQVGRCKLRQPDGKEEVKAKLQGGGDGRAATGATRQPDGKQEANGRGGVQDANGRGGVSGQEAAERLEKKPAAAHRKASPQPAGGASGASSSSSLAIWREGGDQSVYLDSFVTEEAPEPENEKRTDNAVPEM